MSCFLEKRYSCFRVLYERHLRGKFKVSRLCGEGKPYFNEHIHLQEQFVVMYLNSSHKVLGIYAHSKGGITGTVADVRLILCTALKLLATGIILAHSHPSGSLKQSKNDEILTKHFQKASNFLDIKLLDHLILTPDSYKSFVQEGLL